MSQQLPPLPPISNGQPLDPEQRRILLKLTKPGIRSSIQGKRTNQPYRTISNTSAKEFEEFFDN